MGIGTPLHERTSSLCKSLQWREWAGYFAVSQYDTCHDPEYQAIRHAAGLMDASPLFKYDITGKDAKRLMNHVMARNFDKVKIGQVSYCCWCDEDGKVVEDGTVMCISQEHYRATSANPSLRWFCQNAIGMDVKIEDTSTTLAAMSLQGPTSRDILKQVSDIDMDGLKFFRLAEGKLDGKIDAMITRTGYTGDLGYEIWIKAEEAITTWDILMNGGRDYGITPNGLVALDIARIEAGFILIDVDFYSSRKAIIEEQKSSPFEVGLGWTVDLNKPEFIGHRALVEEKKRSPNYRLVGLQIDVDEMEIHFDALGLPLELPYSTWRTMAPLYVNNQNIGRATSGCWSPILKKYIALATVKAPYAKIGTKLQIEVMVEFEKKFITATVVKKPFFNPKRKRKP